VQYQLVVAMLIALQAKKGRRHRVGGGHQGN
jgi:hypothetical protein